MKITISEQILFLQYICYILSYLHNKINIFNLHIKAAYIACKGDPIANLQEDLAAERKARTTYEKLIDLCRDDPDVIDPLRFLRQREIVHFQRFGETLRVVQDKLAEKKFYMNKNSDMNCR